MENDSERIAQLLSYMEKVQDVSNIIDEIVSFDTFWSDFMANNPFLGNIIKEVYEKEKDEFDERVVMTRIDDVKVMNPFTEIVEEKEEVVEVEEEKETTETSPSTMKNIVTVFSR